MMVVRRCGSVQVYKCTEPVISHLEALVRQPSVLSVQYKCTEPVISHLEALVRQPCVHVVEALILGPIV